MWTDFQQALRSLAFAVVNRRLADYLWPGEDAVGRRIRPGSDSAALHTVIGVSRNISNWDISGVPLPTAYVPLTPRFAQYLGRSLEIRHAMAPALRAIVPLPPAAAPVLHRWRT
jgi:hypothetical protein